MCIAAIIRTTTADSVSLGKLYHCSLHKQSFLRPGIGLANSLAPAHPKTSNYEPN